MMSSEKHNPAKDESQKRKTPTEAAAAQLKPPDQSPKCPRCDSSNTKFCYYNNYSLTQPRHFCKTCRRYWTKGGALRNVPIGGGCRKTKKNAKSSSSSSISRATDSKVGYSANSSSSEIGCGGGGALGFRFLQNNLSLANPAMDFQLGTGIPSLPRLQYPPSVGGVYPFPPPIDNHGNVSCLGTDQVGGLATSYSLSSSPSSIGFLSTGGPSGNSAMMNSLHHSDLASSIESLSCINQDLHWKLQQQRYAAMIFGSGGEEGDRSNLQKDSAQIVKPQISGLFQNLEVSKPEAVSGFVGSSSAVVAAAPTQHEWFFDGNNSFTPGAVVGSAASTPPPNSGGGTGNNTSWNGAQAWSDLQQQYSGLP